MSQILAHIITELIDDIYVFNMCMVVLLVAMKMGISSVGLVDENHSRSGNQFLSGPLTIVVLSE